MLRRRIDLPAFPVTVVLTWALVVLPRLAQTLTAPKYKVGVSQEALPASPIAHYLRLLLLVALLAWCVVVLLRRSRSLPSDGLGIMAVFLFPWVFLVVRDLYVGTHATLTSLVYPALVVVAWATRPRMRDLVPLGYLTGLTAVVSVLLGVLLPNRGVFQAITGDLIAPEKQILPMGILIGIFTGGNNLGQFLVLGLPALLLVRRQLVRWLLLAVTVFALVWTSSRSSLGAVIAIVLVGCVLSVRGAPARAALSLVATSGLAALMAYLPLTTHDDEAFTNRGYIWRISLQSWDEHRLVGNGSRHYDLIARYQNALGDSAYHGHNQFVHTLVTGGLVLMVAVVLITAALVVRSAAWAAHGQRMPTLFLVAFMISCTLEVSFGFVDREFLLPVTTLVMVSIAFSRPSPADEGDEPGETGETEARTAQPSLPAPRPAGRRPAAVRSLA